MIPRYDPTGILFEKPSTFADRTSRAYEHGLRVPILRKKSQNCHVEVPAALTSESDFSEPVGATPEPVHLLHVHHQCHGRCVRVPAARDVRVPVLGASLRVGYRTGPPRHPHSAPQGSICALFLPFRVRMYHMTGTHAHFDSPRPSKPPLRSRRPLRYE